MRPGVGARRAVLLFNLTALSLMKIAQLFSLLLALFFSLILNFLAWAESSAPSASKRPIHRSGSICF